METVYIVNKVQNIQGMFDVNDSEYEASGAISK